MAVDKEAAKIAFNKARETCRAMYFPFDYFMEGARWALEHEEKLKARKQKDKNEDTISTQPPVPGLTSIRQQSDHR